MKLHEFEQLNYEEQIEAARAAVCIAKLEGTNYTALLYQKDSFYIEIHQHKKYHYIYSVKGFDDLDRLDPFLRGINPSLEFA